MLALGDKSISLGFEHRQVAHQPGVVALIRESLGLDRLGCGNGQGLFLLSRLLGGGEDNLEVEVLGYELSVIDSLALAVEEQIKDIWEMILSFDGYSFCKPHSASYARVSYQAAYLKVLRDMIVFLGLGTHWADAVIGLVQEARSLQEAA